MNVSKLNQSKMYRAKAQRLLDEANTNLEMYNRTGCRIELYYKTFEELLAQSEEWERKADKCFDEAMK